jgi:hypothetical protein
MRDYAVRTQILDTEPPGPFVVGRGVDIRKRVVDVDEDGVETGLDLTAGRWSARIRAYVGGAAATTRDELLTPASADGDEGWIDHYFSAGTTAYETALRWEIVLVDSSENDANTKTTKREYVLLQWKDPISAAPRT